MSIELTIPRGLEGEKQGTTKVFEGRARSITRGDSADPVVEALHDDDLVEIHWEDGAIVVARARDLSRGTGPVDLAGGRGTRDALGMAIVRLILRPVVARGVDAIVADLDARFLRELPGDLRVGGEAGVLRAWSAETESWAAVKEEPGTSALLLLHGTFSTTAEAFGDYLPGGPAANDWAMLVGCFDRVLAFDHPTLTADPLANLERLAEVLPANAVLTVLSHSRGGLVAELLAVALAGDAPNTGIEGAKLAARTSAVRATLVSKNITLRRLVRVACPAQGTTLMSFGLDYWLNMSLNALGLIPTLRANPVFALVKELLLAVAKGRHQPDVAPGLEAMNPDSPFLRWLSSCSAAGELVAVTGESGGGSVVGRLGDVVAGVVFPDRHDLVVDTAAMVGGAERTGGLFGDNVQIRAHRPDGDRLDHFHYFRHPRCRRTLLEVLDPRLRIAASRAAAAPVPGRKVLLVPDVFASQLRAGDRVVWPSVAALARGGLGGLLDDDVRADALVADAYRELIRGLAPQWEVVASPWAWTATLDEAAAAVEAALVAHQPAAVLAHGVGGWILDKVRRSNGPGWRQFQGRIGLLGVPRLGAWWAWEVLTGRGAMFEVLARIGGDRAHALRDVQRVPSLWAMLPDPPPPGCPRPTLDAWNELGEPPKPDWTVSPPEREGFFAADWGRILTLSGTAALTPGAPGDTPTGDGRVPRASSVRPATASGGGDRCSAEPHGRLGASAGDLTALSRWLDGVGTLEAVAPEARGGGARRRRDGPAEEGTARAPLPSEVDLLAAVLDAEAERSPALRVEVAHGDPALLTHDRVVVVGHPDLARLTRIEVDLDRALGGTLAERLRVGRFPDALGTWTVAVPGPRHLANRPRAVLALGLGRAGAITRVRMIGAIVEALVECALPPIATVVWPESGADAERRLAFSLVGVGRTGLLPEEGTECILEAVVRANERLRREGVAPPYTHLLLVELAGVRARASLERALQWAAHPNVSGVSAGDLHVHPILGVGQGPADWLPEYDEESTPRGRTQRLTVTTSSQQGDDSSDELVTVRFDSTQEIAVEGNSFRIVPWKDILADVTALVSANGWAPSAILGLRNGLLPPRLVAELREGLDLDLSVDRRAAALPWEAFVGTWSGDDDPLASRVCVLRRLRGLPSPGGAPIGNGRALVVCSAGSGATFLPGAGPEADAVTDALTVGGYEVVRMGGSLSALRTALAEPFEILHFVGHGVHVPGRPDKTGFLAEDGRIFSVLDAERFEHNVPALFFFNACHLGRMDGTVAIEAPGEIASGFAEVAIRVGARAVVAAGWPVGDAGAVAFARSFYREMLAPTSYRLAVGAARIRARDASPTDGTWAAYHCYGDPEFVLPSRLAAQLSSEQWSDRAIAAAPVRSARDARDILGRLHRRGQLLDPKEDRVRLQALERLVNTFVDRLPPEIAVDDLDPGREVIDAEPDARDAERARLKERFKGVLPRFDAAVRAAPPILEAMWDPRSALASLTPVGDRGRFKVARDRTADLLVEGKGTSAEVAAMWRDVRVGLTNRQASDLSERLGGVVRVAKTVPRAADLARALQAADPSLLDDPNFLKFGGPTTADWQLSASKGEKHGYWTNIALMLTSTHGTTRPGRATVALHPTFKDPKRAVDVPPLAAGTPWCLLKFSAWGAFTVGVEVDGARLEVDLADIWDDAPSPSTDTSERGFESIKQWTEPPSRRTLEAGSRVSEAEDPMVADTAAMLDARLAGPMDVPALLADGRRALVAFQLDPAAAADPALVDLAKIVQPILDQIQSGKLVGLLTAAQRQALASFNLLVTRPALIVRGDAVVPPPPAWSGIDPANPKIQKRIRGVGRVEMPDRKHAGTGFLLEAKAILTNNHVVCALLGKPLGFWLSDFAGYEKAVNEANLTWADPTDKGPGFERYAEDGVATSDRVRVVGVRLPLKKDADFAVLELAKKPAKSAVVELSKAGMTAGDVYVIGCPGEAFPSDWLLPEVKSLLFGPKTTLGTKRFSPGKVLEVSDGLVRHDAATLPGSSGSCVVDLANHRVVGIHSSGWDAHIRANPRNLAVALWKHRDNPLLAGATWK